MGIRAAATLLSFAPAFFAPAAGGCGLVLDLDPATKEMDASLPDGGSVDRMDANVPPDAARPSDDGGAEDGGPRLDASRPGDAGRPVVDASPALDAGGACLTLPSGSCDEDSDCASGMVCGRPIGDCLGPGTCRLSTPASGCGSLTVCGCNQRTYAHACAAEADGMSIVSMGACPLPMGQDWCPGGPEPSRTNLPCDTILSPCFDDADCNDDFFGDCIGSTGCSAGDEGVCLDQSPSACFRDDACAPGQLCMGAVIRSIAPVEGRCEFP